VIALTYGPEVDWYRNMLAAGGGTLLWHKRVYVVGKPEPIDAKKLCERFLQLSGRSFEGLACRILCG
jgi:hypothetical protein